MSNITCGKKTRRYHKLFPKLRNGVFKADGFLDCNAFQYYGAIKMCKKFVSPINM